MTPRDRASSAAERLAAARQAEAQPEQAARMDPINAQVKLPPAQHYALRDRETELQRQYTAIRGMRQRLMVAMVKTYLTDELTARKVEAQLAQDLRDGS